MNTKSKTKAALAVIILICIIPSLYKISKFYVWHYKLKASQEQCDLERSRAWNNATEYFDKHIVENNDQKAEDILSLKISIDNNNIIDSDNNNYPYNTFYLETDNFFRLHNISTIDLFVFHNELLYDNSNLIISDLKITNNILKATKGKTPNDFLNYIKQFFVMPDNILYYLLKLDVDHLLVKPKDVFEDINIILNITYNNNKLDEKTKRAIYYYVRRTSGVFGYMSEEKIRYFQSREKNKTELGCITLIAVLEKNGYITDELMEIK